MKRVAIVDDEYIVAQGLAQLIQWKEFDMEIVGTAGDGPSGLALIRRAKPDLVFTDIRMPGMSGLDLIREARTYVPNTVFVIVSGFNDFEYIRSALRLKVFDYLDKPITVEKMQTLLNRYNEYMQDSSQGNMVDYGRRCLAKCMELCNLSDEKYENQICEIWKEYGLHVPDYDLMMCVVIDCAERSVFGRFERDIGSQNKALSLHMVTLKGQKGGACLFYTTTATIDARDLLMRLRSILDAMAEQGIVLYAGVSRNHNSAYEIGVAMREARRALDQAVFYDEHCLEIDDVEYSTNLPTSVSEAEQSIALAMRIGDRENVYRVVRSVLNTMAATGVTMELYCHEALELVYLALRVLREAGISYSVSPDPPHVEIQRYRSIGELQHWIMEWFERCLDLMESQNQSVGRKSVQRAREYIDKHFNQPITLEQLAAICDMNPTYFSVLFKNQVGQTYVKYIGQVRMEQARSMLLSGMSIHQVSAHVGFTSQRYFTDRFKMYWGCTPTQLREKMKQGGSCHGDN